MAKRPQIPAEIKRQVFTEAGHRCAVCGASCALEQAHIVPWGTVKAHRAENLICLCTNCHTRSHAEHWGVKTLRSYKEKPWIHKQGATTGPPDSRSSEQGSRSGGTLNIGGSVNHSNIIIGDNNTIHPPDSPEDHGPALAAYRRAMANFFASLPMRGKDFGASDPSSQQQQVELDQVYVNLDTTTPLHAVSLVEEQANRPASARSVITQRPMSALEAAAANRRLVLLGDPGSGKSTFLDHLCLCLAWSGLDPASPLKKRLKEWPAAEADLLPIHVTLRDFARTIGDTPPAPEVCTLWSFIAGRLRDQHLHAAEKPLLQALDAGHAIVLLDGLDEIPTMEQEQFVHAAVEAFANRFHSARFIVTCRALSYQNAGSQLRFKDGRGLNQACPAFTLAPFSEEKIDQFIDAWYADLHQLKVLKAAEAKTMTDRLRKAIRREDLWRLAPNPLLLTVMALVHTHKGQLPDARALLYEDTVDLLLWRWEQIKRSAATDSPPLRQLMHRANLSDVDLKRALWALAFEAHQHGGTQDALADIDEAALERALADLHPDGSLRWSREMIATIKLRAGLLIERTGHVFTFPHRTFQEYLAGAHLGSLPDFANDAVELAADATRWREVILLAVGRLVYLGGDVWKPLLLVAGLCPEDSDLTESGWRKAWLAAEVLLEIGKQRAAGSKQGRDLLKRIRLRLVALLEAEALSPVERAKVGALLGRIGDPRSGVGITDEDLPDIGWSTVIDAGPFPMGNDRPQTDWDAEGPRHDCTAITEAFVISLYPVTVVQFEAFVKDRGYQDDRWWADPAARRWRISNNISGPEDLPEIFQTFNHPQVGVSWFEAIAFCAWLSDKTGRTIRLPSEVEWERAARHTDARSFPWGEEDPERHANVAKTAIGSTSAVGLFPSGKAQCGAFDLSGNVWEWTRTPWMQNYKSGVYQPLAEGAGASTCAMRGGSFSGPSFRARCAGRGGLVPGARRVNLGFRVVSSPF